MTDEEGRGLILQRLYDLRDTGDGRVQLSQLDDLGFPEATAGRYVEQLKQLGLADGSIHKSSNTGRIDHVYVNITGPGSEAIENPNKRPAQVIIQNTSIHNSIIGNHNQQNISLDVNKFYAAIENADATREAKEEAKSIVTRILDSKLLVSLLGPLLSTMFPAGSAG